MSLIHSAELSKVNPFEYLVALHRNHAIVEENPEEWMPWNYGTPWLGLRWQGGAGTQDFPDRGSSCVQNYACVPEGHTSLLGDLAMLERLLSCAFASFVALGVAAPPAAQAATPQAASSRSPLFDVTDTALVVIDYQPQMFAGLVGVDPKMVELNVRFLARAARLYKMPIVLSTVSVGAGVNSPTIPTLLEELPGLVPIDRTTMDAWQDPDFLKAVRATGKKKIIMLGLWTEICVVFPTLDAIADGYKVMIVTDAIGGTSALAHETGIRRMIQAGATPTTAFALSDELFKSWDRQPYADVKHGLSKWYAEELKKIK